MALPALRKILLVDDQREIRSIAGLSLGKIGGFTLKVCDCGEEALQTAAAFAPDLLLLDMNMPGLDGVATLRQLRAQGIAAPAIFFSGHLKQAEVDGYRDLGALGLIPKPFDPLKLAGQLREMWKRHFERE
jgi:two-component system OmpR family response regulator